MTQEQNTSNTSSTEPGDQTINIDAINNGTGVAIGRNIVQRIIKNEIPGWTRNVILLTLLMVGIIGFVFIILFYYAGEDLGDISEAILATDTPTSVPTTTATETSTAIPTTTPSITPTPAPTSTSIPTATPSTTPTPTLSPPAADDETLILIADILVEPCIEDPACPADPNHITQRFIDTMRETLIDHPSIRIERLPQYFYAEGGGEEAMAIGESSDFNAAYVMWGNYVLQPDEEIYIYFDIMDSDLPYFGRSYDEAYGPSLIQPSMFDFKAQLGSHWGQMTAFAAGLALFQQDKHKDAVTFFETVTKNTGELLSNDMMRVLHYYRGFNYFELGRALEAKPDIEALETKEQLGISDDLTNPILVLIGVIYSRLGDKQQALDYLNQALPLLQEAGNQYGRAATLNNIGRVYADLGDKQEALDYYNQALSLTIEVGDKSGQATTLNNIGKVYSDLGDKQEVLDYYNQALLLWGEISDKSGQATALNNIGKVYSDLGDKQEALDYLNQALLLWGEISNKYGQASTLNNIGTIYEERGDRQQALDYFSQALPLLREVGNKSGEAATLGNIGRVHFALEEYQEALDYLNQSLPLSQETGDVWSEATILNNIGAIYSDLEEYEKALDYFDQTLPVYREVGYKLGEGRLLTNMGRLYADQENYDEALVYYEQALSLLMEVKDAWGEIATRYNMGNAYFALNQLSKAEEQFIILVEMDTKFGHPNLDRDQQRLAEVQQSIADQESDGSNKN